MPMSVPLIDPSAQHAPLMPQLEEAFRRVVESGQYILGPFVEAFERDLAQYVGARHAVGVSSGTDALTVAMMALGIGPGDEVITTPFTFFCTASCVTRLGARPVFVDINPRTFNIEADAIEGAITERTRAIIPVHLFGLPANLEPILELAKKHNLRVIEDAAQALGARYEGKPVGPIGDIGCYSFYPTKNMPALGDAGACVTNDDELAEKLRILRVHGLEPGRNYFYRSIGGNFRLDALQAALLSVKLPHIEGWNDRRRVLADRYGRSLEELPVSTPFEPSTRHHVYSNYTVRVRAGSRESLLNSLQAAGVAARVYYPLPLHLQPAFESLGHRAGRFPVAEAAAREVLSLPIYPEMTEAVQDEVIAELRDYFRAE
jgi:dTDP-4-amino-4,6-dideoxygalactose transaminase